MWGISLSFILAAVHNKWLTEWDYAFEWTENHLSSEAEPLRHQYDELGAIAFEKLLAIRTTRRDAKAAFEEKGEELNKDLHLDLYAILPPEVELLTSL